MKFVIDRSEERGHVCLGWLDSKHSFSFGQYYNPSKINFGLLRVLNDDKISGGQGFGMHPHENMEIITIPLKGDLEHKDSMGNTAVIKNGDIQVMSAGTGIYHSEFNHSKTDDVELLQIWIFPDADNYTPRYDQKSIAELLNPNEFSQVLNPKDKGNGVWIHQNAYMSIGEWDNDVEKIYAFNIKDNGAYIFVIEGTTEVEGNILLRRDAMGIWETDTFKVKSIGKSKFLIIEVPIHR